MKKKGKSGPLTPEVMKAPQASKARPKDTSAEPAKSVPVVVKGGLPQIRKSGAITPTPSDPLARYLAEIRRYEVMSPEDQQAMAVKMRETGDLSLAKALVTTNLRLVVKIALEYKSAYNNVLDLIQEGNVGLMKAVSNYDPYKGTRLSYYASWWIRSYILKFLLDNFRLVKVGTTQAQKKLFYNLMREKDRLEAQGIQAGPKLLADTLNVKEKDVKEMSLRLSSKGGEYSIDQTAGDGDERAPRDSLVDPGEGAYESLAKEELRAILADHISEFVQTLNEKERIIFQERMMSEDPKTLQEVADKFGITRERARQIEAKVVEKLRKHMSMHMDGIDFAPAKK
jgi:RNA polymerase sigma-32 factor